MTQGHEKRRERVCACWAGVREAKKKALAEERQCIGLAGKRKREEAKEVPQG
jgi:hypothetical protein